MSFEANARHVLVVDDEAAMRSALDVSFARRGWKVASAAGTRDALASMQLRRPDLVITDVRMPDGDGFAVMNAARKLVPQSAVILLTAFASVPDAVSAMKSGACEYLVKPVSLEQLLETADRVCAAANSLPRQMIGSSPALRHALDTAQQAAASDADILIQAESGTGKELLARMVHSLSARRECPFIAINCAGIPESLLESELFGHGRGAFTGAEKTQLGKFQLADTGTLLLDEVGEMPLSLQPKLLRALQEREFYPLGEARPVKVNIRVVATTNRPLATMVSAGTFRSDLYYRLNVIPLSLPPLRERREDIRELAKHFARTFGTSSADAQLPEPLLSQFERYAWPGNVRELANAVRRTLALRHESELAGFANAFSSCSSAAGFVLPDAVSLTGNGDCDRMFPGLHAGTSLQEMERQLLEITLDATHGNRSRAAEMLGVSLRTVRNKIREYNLPPRRQYAQGND
jgi:DNA-binding NtrC family response regulator